MKTRTILLSSAAVAGLALLLAGSALICPAAPVPAGSQLGGFAAGSAVPDVPPPSGGGAPARAQVKDWTIISYIDAYSDLSRFGPVMLGALERTGSTDKVNVVAEIGQLNAPFRRLFLRKSAGNISNSVVVDQFAYADMGDYNHLADFIIWAKKNYPARHYMFLSFGHGLGWLDLSGTGVNAVFQWDQAPKGRSSAKGTMFTDKPGGGYSYITTPQLGEIFRKAGPVDVYYTYSCLMQMAETTYELKDRVKVFVGSEEVMLINEEMAAAYGLGLERAISGMTADPDISPEDVGAMLVAVTRDNVLPRARRYASTLSMIRASALGGLAGKLAAFASAVRGNDERLAAAYAIGNAVRMVPAYGSDRKHSSYVDLYDFARLVSEKAASAEARSAGRDLMGYISGPLVAANAAGGGPDKYFERARGIAIEMTKQEIPADPDLLPNGYDAEIVTKYGDLALSKASRWDEFLSWTNKVWLQAKEQ